MTAYEYLFKTKNEYFYNYEELEYVEWNYNYLKFLSELNVVIDEKFENKEYCCARRPYYRIKGKTITEEQAKQILEEKYNKFAVNFGNEWVKSNGEIRVEGMMGRNPTIHQIISEWSSFLYKFPYIDLVVGITYWDESPKYRDMNNKDEEFLEAIECVVKVKQGCIEIVGATEYD